MGKATLEVFITASAREDLDAIWRYWADRDEPERGEKYATDLHAEAVSELSNPQVAKGGKTLRDIEPPVREIRVFLRVYRIPYRVDETLNRVEVLRFWHSHRDEPAV